MPDSFERQRKSVLVLGASGFVGSRLVAALSESLAYRPIAASRRAGLSVDATNAAAVRAALRDVDYVVNCIAGNGRTMTTSTQVLCDAARANPPVRIVHLSSMAIYGAATGTVAEDRAPVSPVSDYGVAKMTCEQIVRKYVHDGGDAVILRPTCVFGPGSPQWTTRVAHLLLARRLGDLGTAGDGCCNLAFIDDLVAGIICALSARGVSGRAFNISSSSALTWNEFLLRFGKALGATPVRRISQRRLKLETKLLAPARRIAKRGFPGMGVGEAITPSLLALMGQDIHIDCSAAASMLSLPRTSAERMIAVAVNRWMNERATGRPVARMEPARP
ncbi:NAD-dependent epimerase/dehydratase family protein [Rhodopila sp.]|uniref:NAD-dependent epimerase/dehydratase family protein n=1 Tax=Rhodopila sp. TaxID=2480087 RepID=UPI003D0BA038